MEKYTQEEIKSLQKSLDGEASVAGIPSVPEIKDVIRMVNQGILKQKSDSFDEMYRREYWSSDPSKDRFSVL